MIGRPVVIGCRPATIAAFGVATAPAQLGNRVIKPILACRSHLTAGIRLAQTIGSFVWTARRQTLGRCVPPRFTADNIVYIAVIQTRYTGSGHGGLSGAWNINRGTSGDDFGHWRVNDSR